MDMTTLSAKVTNSYHVIDLQFLPSDNYNKNCNIHNRKKRHKCASKSRGDKAYSVHPVSKSRGDLSLCPPYDRRPWGRGALDLKQNIDFCTTFNPATARADRKKISRKQWLSQYSFIPDISIAPL